MSGAKNVIDMRPSKGFSPSQGNEHLRRLDDCERAQKARWNYDHCSASWRSVPW